MQSQNINKSNSLTEVLNAVLTECKASCSAQVISVISEEVTLFGDFSEFIFSENPNNSFTKQLVVTKGADSAMFSKCVLVDATTVTIQVNSNLPLSQDDIITVKEADPFIFKGTLKAVHLLQKAQPACIILNPTSPRITQSEQHSSSDADYGRVQLVFTDNSQDFDTKFGDTGELNTGYIGQEYQDYIEKPLAAFIAKFKSKLDHYVYEGAGINTTVVATESTDTFLEFFGKQDNFPDTELENISGWVIEMNIRLLNQTCLRDENI